jgi:hypothetical protein
MSDMRPFTARLLAEVDALHVVGDALRRGTKRSRLRLLVAVCPNNRTLAEVFRGSDNHDYIVFRWSVQVGAPIRVWAARLDDDPWHAVRCRCHQAVVVDMQTLRAGMARGERRVVIEPATHG